MRGWKKKIEGGIGERVLGVDLGAARDDASDLDHRVQMHLADIAKFVDNRQADDTHEDLGERQARQDLDMPWCVEIAARNDEDCRERAQHAERCAGKCAAEEEEEEEEEETCLWMSS